MKNSDIAPASYAGIQADIVGVVESARQVAVRHVNAVTTAAYWLVGRRIIEFEQAGEGRAEYGEALIKRLAVDLSRRFGRGFMAVNLSQMRRFYLTWPPEDIFQTASEKLRDADMLQTMSEKSPTETSHVQSLDLAKLAARFPLPWSAYVRLLSVRNSGARAFYQTEALRCGWSVRQLDRQIESQFYERIAVSKNKAAMLKTAESAEPPDLVTPEAAIKDPFVLEFLALKDEYSGSDLEDALIQRLADFLLELGDEFAFIGRQRRLRIDDTWFRVDLGFFHRRLRRLIIIDLKAGRFSYADAGQMHLYLNYAKEHWMMPGENPPVGLILCAEKGAAEAHYALDNLPNKVLAAEYQTVLPDEQVIADALQGSRQELEDRRRLQGGKEDES
jgi:predicted nuclease of restriction endonuclease-like (RecB) superfamily